jgi:predicted DNA-binding WGR domain protein
MTRLSVFFGLLMLTAALLVGSGYGQGKDGQKDPPPVGKVQLPANWGKIGLTGDQKKKVYEVLTVYQNKIDALEVQIEQLKKERYAEAYKLLTDDQKANLKKIASEKTDPVIKDDKKVEKDPGK